MRPIGGGALSNAHTHTGTSASTQTASQHALQETKRDRSKAMGVSTRARDLRPVLTRRTHPHPSHQSSTTAPSQPAVWPCQMTYDTQHLRPIGGGALSNAHTHREGREQQAHKRHRSMHCKRQRDRSKALGVSTRARDLHTVLTRRTHPHTHPTNPTAHNHSSKPASRVDHWEQLRNH